MKGPKTHISSNENILIIGGGKFGRRAAIKLHDQSPESSITLVEKEKIENRTGFLEIIQSDGVEWFASNFSQTSTFTHIIPALPIHLAGEWAKMILQKRGFSIQMQEIPAEPLESLPNPYLVNSNLAALSYADFRCPPNCEEPSEICTFTKKKRPTPLYHILESLDSDGYTPVIIQSRQFSSGVGGFFPRDLWHFLKRIINNRKKNLLVGTACKCHGIVESFSVI